MMEDHKDKGWAWVVCLGTFFIYLIHPSYFYVTSVLFLDFIEVFNTSAAMVNIILAMTNVVYCISAFVLVNLVMPAFTIRILTTVCSLIYSLTTLAVVIAPTLPVFFVVCVVKYIAQGGVLVPSLTLVGLYFERRRALATSLSLLGISVATVTIPPVITYLRKEYGFRGCFLLLSAFEMNAVVASLLLRPVSSSVKISKSATEIEPEIKDRSADIKKSDEQKKLLTKSTHKNAEPYFTRNKYNLSPDEKLKSLSKDSNRLYNFYHKSDDNMQNNNKNSDSENLQVDTDLSCSDQTRNNLKAISNLDVNTVAVTARQKCFKTFQSSLDISLLQNYTALLYLFSFGLNHSGAFIATYLPSYAILTGISPPDAALLMTISGCCDAVSRVAYGCLADLRFFRPNRILATACLILGVACQFTPFYNNLASFSFLAVIYGCCGMAHLSLNTPLIVDLLGIDQLGKVFALGALASSSFISVQFPLHGVLIEMTGEFTASFHWIGTTFIISAACLWLVPLVKHLQGKRTAQHSS